MGRVMDNPEKKSALGHIVDFARKHPAMLLALIPATVSILLIDSCTVAWCDELCLCDGMYMRALRGIEWSAVSACAYNPLYPMILYLWAKLFGASHFAVCTLSVIIGYSACVVISSIARRRGWWKSMWSDAAFVFLFWGGWQFAPELTTARPDVLALLLAALFADALARDGTEGHHLLRVFTTAAALFLSAPYPIPLMFFFGLFLLATAKCPTARKLLVARGFAAAAGFAIGFILAVVYYAIQQDLMRLIGSYVYFNTITGFSPAPFWTRVANGYLYDIAASVIVILSLSFGKLDKRLWAVPFFVLAIPFLMTLGGRFEHYYQWTFYVPCILLAVHALSSRSVRAVSVLTVIGMAIWVSFNVNRYMDSASQREFNRACRSFVEKHSAHFGQNTDVIVAENVEGRCNFYYPLMSHGARVWFRGENALNGRSDEEKFKEGLAFIPCSDETRTEIFKFIAKVQRFVPLLPEKGLVLFYSNEDVKTVKPLFESKGCILHQLEKAGDFSLWKMERKVACE